MDIQYWLLAFSFLHKDFSRFLQSFDYIMQPNGVALNGILFPFNALERQSMQKLQYQQGAIIYLKPRIFTFQGPSMPQTIKLSG